MPASSLRPSATSPRSTTVKAHSACEVAAGRGRGRWTRRRWSREGLTNRVPHPDHGLVGPELDGGHHLDGVAADPRLGGVVDPVGPGVGGGDGGHGPRTGPRSSTAHRHRVGRIHLRILLGRRVVVGVAVVAVVDQPPVPGHAVEGEGAVGRVDGHGDQSVGQGDRRGAPVPSTSPTSSRTGWARVAALKRDQPKPGTASWRARIRRTGGWSSVSRTSVCGSGREPGVQLTFDLLDRHPVPRLGADDQGDVEAGLVHGQRDVGDVGVVADAGPLEEPQHVEDGAAVQGEGAGQAGPLRHHLDVGAGRSVRRHHDLDQPAPVAGRRVDHHRPGFGHGPTECRQAPRSVRPSPMWRASA